MKDSDFLSKPKAFNFAISKPWGMKSKVLERSVRTVAKTHLLSLIFLIFFFFDKIGVDQTDLVWLIT